STRLQPCGHQPSASSPFQRSFPVVTQHSPRRHRGFTQHFARRTEPQTVRPAACQQDGDDSRTFTSICLQTSLLTTFRSLPADGDTPAVGPYPALLAAFGRTVGRGLTRPTSAARQPRAPRKVVRQRGEQA